MTAAAAPDWGPDRGAPRDARGLGPGRRFWRDGWDTDERCLTPDPKSNATPGRQGWRASPVLEAKSWWVEAHQARRRAVRSLRMAGYVARRRYGRQQSGWRQHGDHRVASWTYLDGPAKGQEAIDPWKRAQQLHDCAASWSVLPLVTSDGALGALPIPSLCGQAHVCPVCSAKRSRELARELRAVLTGGGRLALVTLTQTAIEGESLADALERWRRAWVLMMRGRRARRLRKLIRGWYYGIEVKWNEGANWWHLHGHVVIGLRDREWIRTDCSTCGAGAGHKCISQAPATFGDRMKGVHKGRKRAELGQVVTVEQVRRALGEAWKASTETASPPEKGWDPLSGCWDQKAWKEKQPGAESASDVRKRIAKGDWSGGWYVEIDAEDPKQVYQACKYPTPVTELGSVQLVEFLAATHGRRWHQGGWDWRGIRKQGREALAEEIAEDPERQELGTPIASMAPGHVPALDKIIPDRGTEPTTVRVRDPKTRRIKTELVGGSKGREPEEGTVSWTLVHDAHELAEQWSSEGWADYSTRPIRTESPATPDDPDAVAKFRRHPGGDVEVSWVIVRERIHPVLTISRKLAAELVRQTEAKLAPSPPT